MFQTGGGSGLMERGLITKTGLQKGGLLQRGAKKKRGDA